MLYVLVLWAQVHFKGYKACLHKMLLTCECNNMNMANVEFLTIISYNKCVMPIILVSTTSAFVWNNFRQLIIACLKYS